MTASVQQQTADDPMTAAMEAPSQEKHFFGTVATIDSWFCVLEKGKGKRPWDKTQDSVADRRIVITLGILCAKRDGSAYTLDQETMNFEKTWTGFTLPSLQKLGVTDLRTLKDRPVHVKRVATGETYTNKAGEVKTRSAIVFVQLFGDAAELQEASELFYNGTRGDRPAYTGMPEATLPDLTQPQMPPEQQFALNSLPALWNASGHDAERFKALITQNPLISKYYPATHPQVEALIGATIADAADDPLF